MNVNIYYTKAYKNETAIRRVKNKPNSNPIKPNFQKAQMNINSFITGDYRKKDDFSVRINKPNSNPISSKAKNERKYLNHRGLSKFYPAGGAKNQTQTNPIIKISVLNFVKLRKILTPMKSLSKNSNLITLFQATRPKFLVASAAPILVGSFLAYATTGSFNPGLFILALLAIMALHAGANITNDYFDHISGNDWANKNPTPFSGGRRFIQQGILSARATLLEALFLLALGSGIGIVIVLLTKSLFILIIGLIGLLGGFFYTAPPLKIGYRCIGEFVIALLFGLLPVYASYYLQTETIDTNPLLPALIVSILIFLVILINEFPDSPADAAVNKQTLVVYFGVPATVWIYRIALIGGFVIAAAMLIYRSMFFAGLFYLLTLPIAALAIKSANKKDLVTPGQYRASQITILLHTIGSLALTIGFIITGLRNTAI